MTDTPEQYLYRLGLHLPTDRFRALLAGKPLDDVANGAAMFVDVSGFTPLTVSLVEEFGPQRASEELSRRINPMFEAIAGLVFTHGGSVIRFVGDGFTAWFPDTLDHAQSLPVQLPGVVRASIAAIEMLEMMVFFRGLDLKVAVKQGMARRWVVGDPQFGLVDILTGPAVDGVTDVSSRCLPHQARASAQDAHFLEPYRHLHFVRLEDGDLLLTKAGAALVEQSAAYRWQAWQSSGDVNAITEQVKPFVDPHIQQQEMTGIATLGGELRYATPIFLRFRGFDYNTDPNARQKLDLYIRDVQSILNDTRGRLVSVEIADKGSVVFAVFGAPIAYGDDSRRAIHAALTMRDLPHVHPGITEQNIGASRGLLYSGTVGGEVRHEYTSLGDETNIASRLMSADTDGRILISQAVYEDCSEWFDFEEGRVISPKGRVGKIPTYIPIRAKQRVRRDLRKQPLVGRDDELLLIQQVLERVGLVRPQVIRIEGEAGIGKSRLAAEIAHQSQEQKHLVAIGNCLSTARTTAFFPWRSLLRTFVGINDEWSPLIQYNHLEKWVHQHNDGWLSRLPLLSDVLGIPIPDNATTRKLSGGARQQALFSLVIDILYYVARQTPLTLILEDTQWLDEASEQLLIALVARMMGDPTALLIVMLHRTKQEVSHPQSCLEVLQKTPFHRHVVLQELSKEAIGELIRNRMGGVIPSELTDFIYEKSEGNPFFAQEIVGALAERNIIKRVGPRVYLDDLLDKIDIPQTVQGLILARIDSLPESEKLILKLAAVIGKQFEARLLFQSLPINLRGEEVMRHFRSLEDRQFIVLESLYPEPVYIFRHAITQEVAYQTLLYDQRRQWHHNVGIALEKLHPESWERLAYHFSHTNDRDQAYVYLVRAGDRSAYDFANQAALAYWERALALTHSPQETFDLLCKRLELLMRTADPVNADQDLQKIVELADQAPENLNWQLRKYRYQAEHALNQRQWHQAREYSQVGLAIAREYRDPQILWELHSIQAQVYNHLNDRESRHRSTQQLREIAIELNDPGKRLRLAMSDALELAQENLPQALETLERLKPQIIAQADPLIEANYWNTLSQIAIQNRLLSTAENALKTQLYIWRQVGNRRMECNSLLYYGITLYHMGQYSLAGTYLRDCFTTASQVEDRWMEAVCLVYLGALAFRRDAFGEAAAFIDRGLAHLQDLDNLTTQAQGVYLMGLVELGKQDYPAAQDYFRHALATLTKAKYYEAIPQIELALAYTVALNETLPLREDFESALAALTDHHFTAFHEPDIAFWQAYYLHKRFFMDGHHLREAFRVYLQTHLDNLRDPQSFLKIGYIPTLIERFDLKQF